MGAEAFQSEAENWRPMSFYTAPIQPFSSR